MQESLSPHTNVIIPIKQNLVLQRLNDLPKGTIQQSY